MFYGAGDHNPGNYQLSKRSTELEKPFLIYINSSGLFLWLCCHKTIVLTSYGHVTEHNMSDQSIVTVRCER